MHLSNRHQRFLTDLRDVLSGLFPDFSQAQWVLADAGLPRDLIDPSGPAKAGWQRAIDLARQQRLVGKLLDVVAKVHPGNLDVQQLRSLDSVLKEGEAALRPLQPSHAESSPRLEEAVKALDEAVERGRRRIALRGRPGDGKTQVANLFAAKRPGGLYLPLASVAEVQPSRAWRTGLQVLLAALVPGEDSDEPVAAMVRRIRDALAGMEDVTLVFDNADAPPDFSLADLVPARGNVVCVVVGSGVVDVEENVHLRSPHEDEFIDIAVGDARVGDEQRNVIASIGRAASHSALVAKYLAWGDAAMLPVARLREYESALQDGSLPQEEALQQATRKFWASLGDLERQRLAFLGALGEPEVPLGWLPKRLRQGPPSGWRMLDRSRVAERTGEEYERVRLHRVVAEWSRKQVLEEVDKELAATLEAWDLDPTLGDELKARGLRSRAFTSAFRLLDAHGHLPKLKSTSLALLSKRFLDLMPRLSAEETEEDFARVVPNEEAAVALAPYVQGQLLDVLTGKMVERSETRRIARERALGALRQRFLEASLPAAPAGLEGWMDVSAVHHLAKELMRGTSPEEVRAQGQALLRWEEKVCLEAAAREPSLQKWHLQLANARFQLGRSQFLTKQERIPLLERVISTHDAPDYLRLSAVVELGKLDALTDEQRQSLLDRGLDLCRRESTLQKQVEFLRWASNELSKTRDLTRFEKLHEVAQLAKYRIEQSHSKVVAADAGNLAFSFRKVAASIASVHSLETLGAAVSLYTLYARGTDRINEYHKTHIASLLREVGMPDLAKHVISELVEDHALKGKNRFFAEFEQAKTLRWLGAYELAGDVLRKMLERHPGPEDSCPVRDEFAKVLVSSGKLDAAAEVLAQNAEQYPNPLFRAACRRWRDSLGKENPRSRDGLLEDEWLRQQRESASTPTRVEQLQSQARALYDAVMVPKASASSAP